MYTDLTANVTKRRIIAFKVRIHCNDIFRLSSSSVYVIRAWVGLYASVEQSKFAKYGCHKKIKNMCKKRAFENL